MKRYKGRKNWLGGKKLPREKNGPSRFFPGEKTDLGEIQQDISKTVCAKGLKLGQLIGDDE